MKLALGRFFAHPSRLVQTSAVFYVLHFLIQGKIAGAELGAFWAILFLTWAISRGEERFSWHLLYFPLILYGVVSTFTAIIAFRRIHQGYEGMLWFKMLLLPCAVILYRALPRLREFMLNYVFVLFGGGMAIWALIEFFILGHRDLDNRVNGPATHVMTFSNLILPMSLVFVVVWMYQKKWWQGALAALISTAVLLTFTRSAWFGWLAAVIALLMMTRSQLRYYFPAAVVLFLTFMPMSLFARLTSTFDPKLESNFDRVRMIQAGVELIKDYPVFGVGPGNVKELYSLYKKQDAPRIRPPHLHNNIIQLWAERGIAGLFAYVLLIVLFLRECFRARNGPHRMYADVGIAVTVALAVAGLFEFNFGDTEVFYLLMNLYAFVLTAIERGEPQREEMPMASLDSPSLMPAQ